MIVVVGSQSRKLGKTTAVCEILQATKDRAWIAVKISPHAHGAGLADPILAEATAPDGTDSGRYIAAGAARSYWIRSAPDRIEEALRRIPPGNWIIESNSVLNVISPDAVVFLADASIADAKPSGRALAESPVRMSVPEAIEWIRRQPASAQQS